MGAVTMDMQSNVKVMRTVNIEVELDAILHSKWQAVTLISPEMKKQFFSNVLNDMLEEILINTPELFNDYARRSSRRQ
jgi:hypothetical protein